MNPASTITIGVCTHGPVFLSNSTKEELKFSIVVIEYIGTKHVNLISCKTTSQHLDKTWPDEIYLTDLFGKGHSKIQVSNIIRIRKEKIPKHVYIGTLHPTLLVKFKVGLKYAIKIGQFSSAEALDLADSWKGLFTFPEEV